MACAWANWKALSAKKAVIARSGRGNPAGRIGCAVGIARTLDERAAGRAKGALLLSQALLELRPRCCIDEPTNYFGTWIQCTGCKII